MLIIEAYKEAYQKAYIVFADENTLLLPLNTFPFKCMLYIYPPMQFKKNQAKTQVSIDFKNKVNTMIPAYMTNLELKVRLINIRAQKIDSSILETFGIVLAIFLVKNKLSKAWFF